MRLGVAREHVRAKLTRKGGLHGEIRVQSKKAFLSTSCEHLDPAVPEEDQCQALQLLKLKLSSPRTWLTDFVSS